MAQYILGIYNALVAASSSVSVPQSITFAPSTNTNVIGGNPTGQVVAVATVTMSPIGASFTGTLGFQNSDQGHYTFSGSTVVTATTPLSGTPVNLLATATQNGVTTSSGGVLAVSTIFPSVTSMTWSPASPSVVNNAGIGTLVATATPAMSLTSAIFPSRGTLTLLNNDSGNYSVSGLSVYVAATPISVGTHNIVALATDPFSATSTSNGGALAITVTSAGAATLLGTMRVTNIAGSAAPNPLFHYFASPFLDGAVPAGNVIQADVSGVSVPLGLMQQNTAGDGSTQWAEFFADFSGIAAINGAVSGASVTVNLSTIAGTYSSASNRAPADITALGLSMQIPTLATTGSSAPDMDGAGAWIASWGGTGFSVLTDQRSPVGDRYIGIAPYYNGSTKHRFLQARYYAHTYQKTNGTQGPITVMAINENVFAFYSTAGASFTYDCSLMSNGQTIRTWTGVSHIVQSVTWMCGPDGFMDDISGGSTPRILVAQPLAQLRATRKIPPITTTTMTLPAYISAQSLSLGSSALIYQSNANLVSGQTVRIRTTGTLPGGVGPEDVYYTYRDDPSQATFYRNYQATQLTSHAAQIGSKVIFSSAGSGTFWLELAVRPNGIGSVATDMQGASERFDIGPVTGWNAQDFVTGDPGYRQIARVNAMVIASIRGLAVRAVLTNKIVSLSSNSTKWPSLSENLTGNQRRDSYWRDSTTLHSSDIQNWSGGDGVIKVPGGDHMPNAVYGVWLQEGGAHLRDAGMHQLQRAMAFQGPITENTTVSGGKNWYNIAVNDGQNRVGAWNMRDMAYGAFMAKPGTDERTYLEYQMNNQFGFLADVVSCASVAQKFTGSFNFNPSNQTGWEGFSYWFYGMTTNLAYMLWKNQPTAITNISTAATHFNRMVMGLWNVNCPYYGTAYRIQDTYDNGTYVGAWDDIGYVGGSHINASYSATASIVTMTSLGTIYTPLANGDKVLPSIGIDPSNNQGLTVVPPPLNGNTWYYVMNLSGSGEGQTFQFCATSALDVPITFTNTSNANIGTGAFTFHWESACPANLTETPSNATSNAAEARAAIYWAAANGFSGAVQAVTVISSRFGAVNFTDAAKYNFQITY